MRTGHLRGYPEETKQSKTVRRIASRNRLTSHRRVCSDVWSWTWGVTGLGTFSEFFVSHPQACFLGSGVWKRPGWYIVIITNQVLIVIILRSHGFSMNKTSSICLKLYSFSIWGIIIFRCNNTLKLVWFQWCYVGILLITRLYLMNIPSFFFLDPRGSDFGRSWSMVMV